MTRARKPSGGQSHDRRSGNRTPRQTISIWCEGKVAEPRYFDALKEKFRLGSVTVEAGKGNCRDVVKRAARDRKDYDQCWCVFDTESLDNEAVVREAVRVARENKLSLAVSNPAFEYWFLLHFKYTDRPFQDARAVIGELRNHFHGYEKDSDAYSVLKNHTDTAIQNAERVLEAHRSRGSGEFVNPSTGVHELVKALRELGNAQVRECG